MRIHPIWFIVRTRCTPRRWPLLRPCLRSEPFAFLPRCNGLGLKSNYSRITTKMQTQGEARPILYNTQWLMWSFGVLRSLLVLSAPPAVRPLPPLRRSAIWVRHAEQPRCFSVFDLSFWRRKRWFPGRSGRPLAAIVPKHLMDAWECEDVALIRLPQPLTKSPELLL